MFRAYECIVPVRAILGDNILEGDALEILEMEKLESQKKFRETALAEEQGFYITEVTFTSGWYELDTGEMKDEGYTEIKHLDKAKFYDPTRNYVANVAQVPALAGAMGVDIARILEL